MAYNKTKIVESAQKHLNLGKVSQAIAEYQQILKHEPKDQVTLMTIGDLYVRLGETFQALEYFERLAQLFLHDGFLTKAIAIYKKIAKLAPEETKPLERLAELYVQQGVLSEARPLYLHMAEAHLKANRHPQAVALLRKLLEVEPDNLRVQTRLAELYLAIGKQQEATEAYLNSAHRVFDHGDHAEAEKLAEHALRIDPKHPGALTLKARALAALGKRAEAAALLETLPDLEAGTEATALLLEQYLQGGQSERAAALGRKVFDHSKNYELAYKTVVALLDAAEAGRALDLLHHIHVPMIDAGDHERLGQALAGAVERMPGRLEPLELLVDLYSRTSDTFRLPDALGQLGAAAAAAGQLERAKQVYEQLLDRDSENEAVRRRLNQVLARMGQAPVEEAPAALADVSDRAAGAPVVEAAPAPRVGEPPLDEETQNYITQSLTDVDLFSSYGLTKKAVDLLETILQRAPRHTVTLEKLLDFSVGAGDARRVVELAARLEQICLERSEPRNAERFSEMRRRFQRAAGLAHEELAAAAKPAPPAEFTVPTVEAEPVPTEEPQPVAEVEAVPAGESAVHEVDLSEEWAALAEQVEEALQTPPAAASAPEAAPPVEGVTQEIPIEVKAVPAEAEPAEAPPEYELELEPTPLESAPVEPATTAMSSDQFLSELATEINAALGPRRAQAPASAPAAGAPSAPVEAAGPPAQPPAAVAAGSDAPLREVFEEFRAEMGEIDAEKEDLETHYNLGIAFREMGLLEEAIGEFQKVAKENDKGRAFRYAMQCCTLLGLAFMEKGQPAIAAMWYERALQTPGLDQESILALRYDLGIAQELAGDEAAALKSFSQVYALNIDYRDVAERIATLGKRR